ncbi:O-antigen ligase family protein [Desulfosediminicola sp.]|uniref:O-antigen ligase family protein n=1 Tax=Desulfosediminicola sp. TaxID=2886825 RepID=UPI003AF1F0DA
MKIITTLYLVILVFAPTAFGTTELWSMVTVEMLTGLVAVGVFTYFCFLKKRLYVIPGIVPLLLLLAFMVVQLVPLPPELVRVIAPANYSVYEPLFAVAGEQWWIPLTVNLKATIQELFRIGCYALFYIVTVQLLQSHATLKRTVSVVVWLAAIIAFLALIHRVTSPDTLFWFRKGPEGSYTVGPWVYHNQYAGFMELLSPLAIALFLFYKPRVTPDEGWRQRIVDFFTMPGTSLHMFYGVAAVVITMSVFVSLSRGGILTIFASLLIFFLLYNLKRPKHGRLTLILVICCVLTSVSWFGWDIIVAEFNQGVDQSTGAIKDGRLDIWRDCWQLILAFPILGAGFGTFVDIFPSYRTILGSSFFVHAHNDYLELLTDGGVIGIGLAGWFVLAVLHHGWKKIRMRRDKFSVLLGIGAMTGIIAILIHSVTDFNMHNGAVGLYFFFLCGVLVAAGNSRFTAYGAQSLLGRYSLGRNALCGLGVLGCVAVMLVVQYRTLAGFMAYGQVQNIYLSQYLRPERLHDLIDGTERARRLDPFAGGYSSALASAYLHQGEYQKAYDFHLEAARKSPTSGVDLQWLGLLTENADTAAILMEEGYKRARHKNDLVMPYLEYLLRQGERQRAAALMQEKLELENGLVKRVAPFFSEFDFSRDEIDYALPKTPSVWIIYGDYLQKTGDIEGAEYYRSNALNHIDSTEEISPHWYQQLISFYNSTKQRDKAVRTLRLGVESVPNYAPFHTQLGDYYRTEGITYRAEEEYRTALLLDPRSKGAKRGLRLMGLLDAY